MKKKWILLVLATVVLASCHVGRFFVYNFSDIRDYKKFPSHPLTASPRPFHFIEAKGATINLPQKNKDGSAFAFEDRLHKTATVAFMVIRHDTVLYEWYRNNYDSSSIVPSFSAAKSFMSSLIGIAIGEGKIKSANEPITNYLTFDDNKTMSKVTIQHLLDMRSGIKNIENYYNPFGDVAKHYYGRHLKKYVRDLGLRCEPGTEFEYLSVNTQLLGLILEKATGMSNTAYLQEKLWTPIGMEFDASWSIDSKKEGTEKAFCCINARARDFAKFGRLFLNKGNWDGVQIVPKSWTEHTAWNFDSTNNFLYSSQWWHTRKFYPLSDTANLKEPYVINKVPKQEGKYYLTTTANDFFANGHLGQYVYVHPASEIVIVRLGKNERKMYWPGLMRDIAEKNKVYKP